MKIAEKRKEGWVSLTAVGLAIIGRVGHIIIRDELDENEQNRIMQELSRIDMRREADIWQDNILSDGRIVSTRLPVKRAMKKVLMQLDIGDKDLLDVIEENNDNRAA